MSHLVKVNLLLALSLILYLGNSYSSLAQKKGGRATVPPNGPSGTRQINRNKPDTSKHKPKPQQGASFFITVNPLDSSLFLNNQGVEGPAIKGLKPGEYVLTVRHEGYRDEVRPITLHAGQNPDLQINLEQLRGTLSVSPNVAGADIHVRSVSNASELGPYVGQVDGLNLAPGEYEVTVTRDGYERINRKITIKPDGLVYLEPKLDPLERPLEIERPKRPAVHNSVLLLSYSIRHEGKYVIVDIRGASGNNTVQVGSINVSVSNSSAGTGNINGLLNGGPCAVEFVRMENVAEGSFVETPGPSNQWAKLVVRVRPKDSKRPLSFAVNWKSLQLGPSGVGSAPAPTTSDGYEEAINLKRVSPVYPPTARSGRISGVVVVAVEIDERGNVTSAKAIGGPMLLRRPAEDAARQWKFRPARSNGQPITSSQRIQFNFQP